jgi:hypothetical protein
VVAIQPHRAWRTQTARGGSAATLCSILARLGWPAEHWDLHSRPPRRQAFADGDLIGELLSFSTGQLAPIKPEPWRVHDGFGAFQNGRLGEGAVLLREAEFIRWMVAGTPAVATKPDSPAATAAGSRASNPVDQIRQISAAQSGEPQYPAMGDLPEHRHLTACEVLTWIGYRRVIPNDVYYAPFTKEPGLPVEEGVSLLHRSVPEPKPPEDPMNEAERKLMEALRASHVHLFIERNGAFEEVPDTIYEHAVVVNARGSIEVDAKATERDRARAGSYLSRLGPIGDVWFRKTEVLEAWPNTVGDGERPHPRPPEVSEATATSLKKTLLANPTSNAPVGEPMLEHVCEQANPASSTGGAEVVAPAEITGAGEVTAPAPTPTPKPSPPADLELIDLRSEPPKLPRYTINGPYPRAGKEQVDECIKKIAKLDGGRTNRRTIRDWGRHWLRTARYVDIDMTYLEKRFNDPEHEERRRPVGNPRNAG